MKFTSIILIATLLLCGFTLASAEAERMVKVIYFAPSDRPFQWDIPPALDTQMKNVQTFFADQMEAHGYGRKTFNLETDTNGKVVVHAVIGQHNDAHYHAETLNKIDDETKSRFNSETDIYVFVVDVSTERIQGNCGIARFEGGPVMVPATGDCVTGEDGADLIAHELGHALNLEHDFRDESYIMSYGATRDKLSACAASMLNVSPFFNNIGNTANISASIQMLTPSTYPANEENWTLRFNISDVNDVHQVQFMLAVPGERPGVLGCQNFEDTQNTNVEFNMPPGATAALTNNIWIRVVDSNGYVTTEDWTLTTTKPTETKITDTERTKTYITLTYDSPDALVPTNPSEEWAGWLEKLTWEKTPDGLLPRRPNNFMDPEKSTQYYDNWDYFFYSHAVSRLVYDLSNGNYATFEAYFDMPNPCGSIASVEIICLADGVEIYNSGVLIGKQSRNIPISFEIPENTQTLTINVTDAGNGDGCDHFIFANAKLVHREPTVIEVDDYNYTDVNNDGVVNIIDLVLVAVRYGEKIVSDPFPNPDVNRDGIVDINDIILVTQDMPPVEGAPSLVATQRSILNGADLQDAYFALPDTVVDKGIAVLDLLFGNTVPTKTVLLENYPNPFNPETWIPYQLAKPADVVITIRAIDGQVVRRLDVGHREAGRYVNRSRAAYWDGRNALGESVASGLYFYTLTASKFVATRRMLIRK